MVTFSKSQVMKMLANTGKAPKESKPRRKRFTGDFSQRKKWLAEMSCGPGIFFAMKTVSEANRRDHWAVKSERVKSQRFMARYSVLAYIRQNKLTLPVRVQFTRYGPKVMDSSDNIRSALKAVQDGVADAFGVDDKSAMYDWVQPKQIVSKNYGLRIELIREVPNG